MVSDLYLACYQPGGFYVSESSNPSNKWILSRTGSKYRLVAHNPQCVNIFGTLLNKSLSTDDVFSIISRRDITLERNLCSAEDASILTHVLNTANANLSGLKIKLKNDIKESADKVTHKYKTSSSLGISARTRTGMKNYVKTQKIYLDVKGFVNGNTRDILSITFKVVPFKQNTLQMGVESIIGDNANYTLFEEMLDLVKNELISKGYHFI